MSTFRHLFQHLRGEVRAARHGERFRDARRRHPALAPHDTIASVLGALADERGPGYAEKEELLRALIVERRTHPSAFWTAALLEVFYPMLSRLRHRIWGDALAAEDLDQLVVTSFLAVLEDYPVDRMLDRTALRLRQQTERRVFGVVRREQEERLQASPVEPEALDLLPAERWPEARDERVRGPRNAVDAADIVALLVERVGGLLDGETFDLVTATVVCGRRIPVFLDRLLPDLPPAEKHRAYQRVKRRHSRALQRIRPALAHLRCPREGSEGLCSTGLPEPQENTQP